MTLFSNPFLYLFYPNPGNATWSSPKAAALLLVCVLLVVASFGIKRWRIKVENPVTRKLSRSWSSAALWFGIVGFVLIFARVEDIGYVAMRLWWLVWLVIAVLYLFVQVRLFRARHYSMLPREWQDDPREKYLPRRKKK